jgi:hypothetical protein
MLKQTKTVYYEKQAKKSTAMTTLPTLGRLNPCPQVSTPLDV